MSDLDIPPIPQKPIVVVLHKDGIVRCHNDTDAEVVLRLWGRGKGAEVKVRSHTTFVGTPVWENHHYLRPVFIR